MLHSTGRPPTKVLYPKSAVMIVVLEIVSLYTVSAQLRYVLYVHVREVNTNSIYTQLYIHYTCILVNTWSVCTCTCIYVHNSFIHVHCMYNVCSFPRCSGWGWAGLALLLAVCSVLSKEQGVTVVAVCFTIDVFLIQKVRTCACIRAGNIDKSHV